MWARARASGLLLALPGPSASACASFPGAPQACRAQLQRVFTRPEKARGKAAPPLPCAAFEAEALRSASKGVGFGVGGALHAALSSTISPRALVERKGRRCPSRVPLLRPQHGPVAAFSSLSLSRKPGRCLWLRLVKRPGGTLEAARLRTEPAPSAASDRRRGWEASAAPVMPERVPGSCPWPARNRRPSP
ncbi:hypothetical protein JRQ81_001119 [Phrynocephalus forsythii]|uniref:Uncharacterized protein n=1 Tax=Phrynocephalus forsythii TaxID=171643 RepID=A0A9Q0Y6J2_9SAUR|nr:hypothetical protein JRQ81_001119 [Phrynocephalus forsythii]